MNSTQNVPSTRTPYNPLTIAIWDSWMEESPSAEMIDFSGLYPSIPPKDNPSTQAQLSVSIKQLYDRIKVDESTAATVSELD